MSSSKTKVDIKGVGLQHFKVLMDYSKTAILALDRENVLGILETADFLQFDQARLLCCKFLERELHLSNCLGMMGYAWQLGCIQLYTAARQVVLTHFSAISAEDDFLSLSKETILRQSSTVPSICLEAKPCVLTWTQTSGPSWRRSVWTGSSSVDAPQSAARYTWSVRGRATKHSQT
uniref:BTB domain-containing protein n=1 Tax=Anabas testudineus TaxID=64144 RepID=A0A7N6B336_ANATE